MPALQQPTGNITTDKSQVADVNAGKPINQSYYDAYTGLMTQYGLTPMSVTDFNAQMGKGSDPQGTFIGQVLLPAYTQIANQVNTTNAATAKANNQPYTAIDTAYNYGDWRGKDYTDVINNINNGLSAAYSSATVNNQNTVTAPNIEQDTIEQQVQKELQAVQQPSAFVAPTQASEQADITAWQQQLAQINAPTTQWALDTLNKQVNQNYAYNNPYSIGSGNQMQASQDATNQLLMSVVSQQNAQAVSLGQASYQNDYNTAWNTYINQQAQYNASQAQLLNIANISSAQKVGNYGQAMQNAWNTTATQNAENFQNQQTQQQEAYAQQIAQMYQPNSQQWYQPIVNAAAQGATTAGTSALLASPSAPSATSNASQNTLYNPYSNLNAGGYDLSNPYGTNSYGFNYSK